MHGECIEMLIEIEAGEMEEAEAEEIIASMRS